MWHFSYDNQEVIPSEGLVVLQSKWLGNAGSYRIHMSGAIACLVVPNGSVQGYSHFLDISLGNSRLTGVYTPGIDRNGFSEEVKIEVLTHPQFAPTVHQVQDNLSVSSVPLDGPHVAQAVARAIDSWFWESAHPTQEKDLTLYGAFVQSCVDQLLSYGPLTDLMAEQSVTEVMVNGHTEIRIEREGELRHLPFGFASAEPFGSGS